MRTTLSLLMLMMPSLVLAQVTVTVGIPTVRFEVAPPLVVVQSGVQVIEDYDDDVYVVGGRYWARRGDRWYRAHDHRGGWVIVQHQHVPASLKKMTPGKYRRWKRDRRHDRGDHHDHHRKHKASRHSGKHHDRDRDDDRKHPHGRKHHKDRDRDHDKRHHRD